MDHASLDAFGGSLDVGKSTAMVPLVLPISKSVNKLSLQFAGGR